MTMNPTWDPPDGIAGSAARPQLESYYDIYRDAASERGLLLIDHDANWLDLRESDPDLFKQYIPDGVHPTDEALAQMVTPQIIRSLTVPEPSAVAILIAAAVTSAGYFSHPRRPRRAP
jgi:hypothetical protein